MDGRVELHFTPGTGLRLRDGKLQSCPRPFPQPQDSATVAVLSRANHAPIGMLETVLK